MVPRARLVLAALVLLVSAPGGDGQDVPYADGDGTSASDGQVSALANETVTGAGQCEKMLQLESVCAMYQNCYWDAARNRCTTVANFVYPTVAPTLEPTSAGLSNGTCASQRGMYNCTRFMDCEYRAPTSSCVNKPPTRRPSAAPSKTPTAPTDRPTQRPTTLGPSTSPTEHPSSQPTTQQPSQHPTSPSAPVAPTREPSAAPSASPSLSPSTSPTRSPSASPSASPTRPQPALTLAQATTRLPFAANATYRLVLALSSAVPCKTALESARAALGAEPLLSSQHSRTMALMERALQVPLAEADRVRQQLCVASIGGVGGSSSSSSSYNLGCDVVDATDAPGAALRLVRVVESSHFAAEIAAAGAAQRPGQSEESIGVGDAATAAAVRGGAGPGTRVTHLAVELNLPADSVPEAVLLEAALGRVSAAVRRTGGFDIEYDARALKPQPCAFQLCSGSGACVLVADGFSAACNCSEGWSGATCEHQDGIPSLPLGLGLGAGLATLLGLAVLLAVRRRRTRAVKPGGPDLFAAARAPGDQDLPSGGPSTSSKIRAPRVAPLPPRMPGLSEISVGSSQAPTPKNSPTAPRSPVPLLPPRPMLLSASPSAAALRSPAAATAQAGFAGDVAMPVGPEDAAPSDKETTPDGRQRKRDKKRERRQADDGWADNQAPVHEARTPTTPPDEPPSRPEIAEDGSEAGATTRAAAKKSRDPTAFETRDNETGVGGAGPQQSPAFSFGSDLKVSIPRVPAARAGGMPSTPLDPRTPTLASPKTPQTPKTPPE
jgi:hypothetical protein